LVEGGDIPGGIDRVKKCYTEVFACGRRTGGRGSGSYAREKKENNKLGRSFEAHSKMAPREHVTRKREGKRHGSNQVGRRGGPSLEKKSQGERKERWEFSIREKKGWKKSLFPRRGIDLKGFIQRGGGGGWIV